MYKNIIGRPSFTKIFEIFYHLRSSSICKNIWGHLTFTKKEVVFRLKKIYGCLSINPIQPYILNLNKPYLILTEWDEFKELNWNKIFNNMKINSWVYDGRNILDRDKLEKIGFNTFFIGQ